MSLLERPQGPPSTVGPYIPLETEAGPFTYTRSITQLAEHPALAVSYVEYTPSTRFTGEEAPPKLLVPARLGNTALVPQLMDIQSILTEPAITGRQRIATMAGMPRRWMRGMTNSYNFLRFIVEPGYFRLEEARTPYSTIVTPYDEPLELRPSTIFNHQVRARGAHHLGALAYDMLRLIDTATGTKRDNYGTIISTEWRALAQHKPAY
ncbi:MAG TPA: hypothetical protein VD735_01865 [Candidatus Saccharimonadales bacterium]|nr:hypothetical protein [Candidatus Saccharimonadales bacterium]